MAWELLPCRLVYVAASAPRLEVKEGAEAAGPEGAGGSSAVETTMTT